MNGHLRTIGRDLGRMLQALSVMMVLSVLVALLWREFYTVPALLLAGALAFGVGRSLTAAFRDAADPGKLHGMMIAAAGWLIVAAFGSLPFLFVAWTVALDPVAGAVGAPEMTGTLAAFTHPLNGFFESMSGFSGTGLTMATHEDVLPHTLQWWRSFIEWVGGVGVIVLTTAILARPGSGSLTLYESEARSEKIHPSIVSTVRTIWWIFILFTFVSVLLLWVAGMPLWDSINHAMTGLSTGGFSVTDDSIATYDSALIDAALIPVMVLGSIAFPIHYLVLNGELHNLYADLQTRWVFGFFGLGSLAVAAVLYGEGTYATLGEALRYGVFQFVSAASCTGFQTAVSATNVTVGRWPAVAQLTVAFGMLVGAAAGSTVGGIKLVRALTLWKGILFRVSGTFYPDSAVRRFQLDGRSMTELEMSQEFEEAAIITVLWLLFLALGVVAVLLTVPVGPGPDAFTLQNAIFEVASAQGNVGLSTGITDPAMPDALKAALTFNMWIGRLEIIPVLVLLRGLFRGFGVYR